MTTWLAVAVDTTLMLLTALAATRVLQRRAASLRHAVLATAVLAALATPILERGVPAWAVLQWNEVPLPASSSTFAASSSSRATVFTALPSPRLAIDGLKLIAATWAAGAVIGLLGLVVGFMRLQRLINRSTLVDSGPWREAANGLGLAAGLTRPVAILQSDDDSLLIACGLRRPKIVLPRGAGAWPTDHIRIVLTHELAHIRRHDGAIQLAAELLRVVHWFNPIVWLACRRLRQESEHACDDVVLSDGIEASGYASALLAIAQHARAGTSAWSIAPGMAHLSTLEGRIAAMLTRNPNRQPATRRMWTMTALAAAAAFIPLAAASVGPASSPTLVSSGRADVSLIPTASIAAVTDAAVFPALRPARVTRQPLPARAIGSPPIVVPDLRETAGDRANSTTDAPDAQRGVSPVLPGALEGVAMDPSGGVLPGVAVAVSTPAQTVQRATMSDGNGRFMLRDLPPGQYGVALALAGFQTIQSVQTVTSGQTTARNFTLKLGVVGEVITVTCSSGAAALNAAPWGETFRIWTLDGGSRISRLVQALVPTLSAQQPVPVRVGGSIQVPRKTFDVRPPCPSALTSGSVMILEATIAADGRVQDVKALRNVLPTEFLRSAIAAISQWKFTPAVLNGQPTPIIMSVTISYEP
jgi:beta-lactamase regulating signal transducer with metallopeptidase domain